MSELKEKYIQFCCDFYNEHAPEDKIWFGRMFDDCHQEHNKRNSSMYRWQFPLKVLKEQETKIDELQKINSTNQSTLQHFEHEYKKVIAERDALQKRIDSALQMLGDWDDQTYRDDVEQLIGELGDALRGVNDINLTR